MVLCLLSSPVRFLLMTTLIRHRTDTISDKNNRASASIWWSAVKLTCADDKNNSINRHLPFFIKESISCFFPQRLFFLIFHMILLRCECFSVTSTVRILIICEAASLIWNIKAAEGIFPLVYFHFLVERVIGKGKAAALWWAEPQ